MYQSLHMLSFSSWLGLNNGFKENFQKNKDLVEIIFKKIMISKTVSIFKLKIEGNKRYVTIYQFFRKFLPDELDEFLGAFANCNKCFSLSGFMNKSFVEKWNFIIIKIFWQSFVYTFFKIVSTVSLRIDRYINSST